MADKARYVYDENSSSARVEYKSAMEFRSRHPVVAMGILSMATRMIEVPKLSQLKSQDIVVSGRNWHSVAALLRRWLFQ